MSVLWLNGALIDAAMARIDPADRGFTLGDGVFETIKAVGGVPLHARRHFARLRDGAAVLGLTVPFGDDALNGALTDVLRANGLSDAAVRVTLTRGPAQRGVLPIGADHPTLMITAAPLPPMPPPARLVIATCTRRNEFSPLSRIKSTNYLDSVLARREAARLGADDALLLNTQGDLAEASAANVVLNIDGAWRTPRLEDGALPGIARALLIESGAVQVARLTRHNVLQAEAGWLVNSLCDRAISQIDTVPLRLGLPLPARER